MANICISEQITSKRDYIITLVLDKACTTFGVGINLLNFIVVRQQRDEVDQGRHLSLFLAE